MFDLITYNLSFIILIFGIVIFLIALMKRKSLSDKILAANNLTNYASILIILFAYVSNQPSLLDISITYAIINFIATIAFLKFHSMKQEKRGEHD